MNAALSTLIAAVGARPGLHRGKCRYDEQAARQREAGEIDGDMDAVARREEFADAERVRGRRHGRTRPAEVD
jgi:hypothetical protein